MYGRKLSEQPDTVAIVAAIYGLGSAMRREQTPVSTLVAQARTLLQEVERVCPYDPPVVASNAPADWEKTASQGVDLALGNEKTVETKPPAGEVKA
jgi:hypothetical protein